MSAKTKQKPWVPKLVNLTPELHKQVQEHLKNLGHVDFSSWVRQIIVKELNAAKE